MTENKKSKTIPKKTKTIPKKSKTVPKNNVKKLATTTAKKLAIGGAALSALGLGFYAASKTTKGAAFVKDVNTERARIKKEKADVLARRELAELAERFRNIASRRRIVIRVHN